MCPLVAFNIFHACVQNVGEADIRIASEYA